MTRRTAQIAAAASTSSPASTPDTRRTPAAPQDGPFAAEYAALRRHWKWANFSQFFYTFAHLFGAQDVALAVRRLLSPAAAC